MPADKKTDSTPFNELREMLKLKGVEHVELIPDEDLKKFWEVNRRRAILVGLAMLAFAIVSVLLWRAIVQR